MMEVIVEVCRAFALTMAEKKTATVCMPTPRTMMRVEAVRQTYTQVQSFTYLETFYNCAPKVTGCVRGREH